MRTKFFSIVISVFCVCSLLTSVALGQDGNKPNPEKKDETPATKPTPTPAPPPVPSFMDQPDYKAYMALSREKDLNKKIELIETFFKDFPSSSLAPNINQVMLDTLIKATPNDKDRIYQQALKIVNAFQSTSPFGATYSVPNTYNPVVNALYRAGMDDKAEEIANRGIALIDEANARDVYKAKTQMWVTLGQVAFRKGDLKKAEQYLQQAVSSDYDGNTAYLALADIAEKRNKRKQQLDYLMKADAKGILKKDQRAKLEDVYVKEHGSTNGLREILDANYRTANPLPMTVAKYSPSEKRTKRTVLAELFTGSACHPCISADVAFEALLKRYGASDVAVLIYDLHIPGPDPITNMTNEARAKYYKANSTPTYIVNGADRQTGGSNNRKDAVNVMGRMTSKIDAQLEMDKEADITLDASIADGVVKANVSVNNVKGDYSSLKVYIGLVENELSYMGENGIRFHPMAVREFGGENRDGFVLKDKTGNFTWDFNIQKVTGDLKTYLDNYETNRRKDDAEFAFSEKKHEINGKNLSVIAFVQDEKTKNVLQTVFIDLADKKEVKGTAAVKGNKESKK